MSRLIPMAIRGTGSSVPEDRLTNAYFESHLETSDEWIVSRTGVRERRRVKPGQGTLSLALDASEKALKDAGIESRHLDAIICCTFTPEHPLPATACLLQDKLGAGPIAAFDLAAACSGFVYGLVTAAGLIGSGIFETVLVVGADTLSSVTNYEDRSSCILFGDAAGAAVIQKSDKPGQGLLFSQLGSDGSGHNLIWIPGGGSREPMSNKVLNERLHLMRMRGRDVYKFAVPQMQRMVKEAVEAAGVSLDEIKLMIPHQSNLRIIESACNKLGFPMEKTYINIDRFGNTSAASVPLCLDEARSRGLIQESELVMLVAIGAGLTWATALLRL